MTLEEIVIARIKEAMDAAGVAAVAAIQAEISVPFPGPSTAKTTPHLRTSRLRDGIGYDATDGTLTLSSSAPYSAALRDGTDRMAARDFFGPEMAERLTPIIVETCQDHFS